MATRTAVVTHAAKRGPRTSTCSGPVVLFGHENVLLLSTAGCVGRPQRAAPSAAQKGAATQQLRQQQQQPATRHRSTARRLVSTSSTRADTSTAYPMTWPQANKGSSAARRSAALGTPAARYRWSPSASKMNVVGSDSTESRRLRPDWRPCRSRRVPLRVGRRTPGRPPAAPPAHGPHQSALKCTTVGPVADSPRSDVSTSAACSALARISPARSVSSRPIT